MPTLADVSDLREELFPEAEEAKEVIEEEVSLEAAPTEDDVAEAAEEEAVEYFNDLPDAMGWTPEDFYKLKLKTDAGEVYTWSEIKDTLQQTKAQKEELSRKEAELVAKEQAVYSQQQQAAPLSQEVTTAQANLAAIGQAYQQTMASMQQLEQDDDTAGRCTG